MVYGTEAVKPIEMGFPTLRIKTVEEGRNDQQLEKNVDLIEETRDEAAIRLQAYQQEAAKFYNKKVIKEIPKRRFRFEESDRRKETREMGN